MSTFRIRSARAEDAEALWHLDRALVEAGDGMVQESDDLPHVVEDKASRLHARLQDPYAYTLIGLKRHGDAEQLAGYAEWDRMRPAKLRHNIVLAMGVSPTHQGQGLGRLLLAQLLADARKAQPRISRIELCVIADNARARALYDAFGFQVEGVRRGFVRDAQGERDDCLMALRI